ncbi:hypothetical protein BDV25DRAFT_126047 [Aspergillus avenaceus]|uniref:Transcription factor domain-containing protein n=1 Tax=Aspergillus avenaceus TaxID=36643 RepID=A0A5N6U902_ASPAV|nr:hypothetical protein BDV25DRAFT_126047 [Aspergillus avenaceus]
MSGQDDLGYTMLHLAIQMGESLQIINHDPLDLDKRQLSTEMVKSIQRTAWGLFQADTVVHTNFLRPSRVNSVAVDRIDRNESGPDDTWSPYPVEMQARPSYLSQYFDESCHLSSLARDISRHLYQSPVRSPRPRGRKDELYATLRQWERKLPPEFDADREPPPHILLLRMRYNSLLIGLARDGFGVQSLLSGSDEQRQTMDETSRAISLTAAQAISALARLHRRLYGMERAHQFATYAIVLGLFTMLDHPSFDILDPDFLSLTSGFSIIASRSQVGRYLFHIFRQSVRSRHQDERILQSDQVSDEVKELFGRHPRSQVPDRWSDYAQGLERYHSSFLGDSHDYAASDVRDMLEKYERLSLGREDSFEGRNDLPKP